MKIPPGPRPLAIRIAEGRYLIMPQILPRLGRCAGSILILSLLMAGGCQVLGIIASKAPAPTVPPAYDGLAGQTAAVWVWVDPAIDLDYPRLSLDLASRIQSNLEKARDEGSGRQRKELEGLQFTIVPESIVKYQKRDPTLNMRPITSIAPRLDVDRLIYVEVMDFTTQGGAAPGGRCNRTPVPRGQEPCGRSPTAGLRPTGAGCRPARRAARTAGPRARAGPGRHWRGSASGCPRRGR